MSQPFLLNRKFGFARVQIICRDRVFFPQASCAIDLFLCQRHFGASLFDHRFLSCDVALLRAGMYSFE